MKKINIALVILGTLLSLSLFMPRAALAASCENSSQAELQKCLKTNPIVKDLNTIVTFLSAAVGIAVIGALIYAGIRYSIAGDNPQEVGAAKQKIINALIALVFYISIFSIVQWLIPGGLFN